MPPEIKAALNEAHMLVHGTPMYTSDPMLKKTHFMELTVALTSPNTPN